MFNPFKKAQSLTGDIVRGSALSPLLWLCLEISVPCFAAAFYLGSGPLMYIFLLIGAAPVGLALRAYAYFMTSNPDALRSERYNIELKQIELLGSRDHPSDANVSDPVKNPDLLDSPDDEKESDAQ